MDLVIVDPLLKTLIDDGRVSDPQSPKGRLLVAAAKLFCLKGYSRTTVRDLAAEVGILSGSIFHHFKNKDEILFAVMNEVVIAMVASLEAALGAVESTREKLHALVQVEVAFMHGDNSNATAVLMHEWRALSAERQKQVLEGRSIYYKLWEEVLEQALRERIISIDPFLLRQLIHGAIAWTSNWYKPGGDFSQQQLVDSVLQLMVDR